MNPFTPTRPSRSLLPGRVEIPGVDQEEVEALREELDYVVRTRRSWIEALIRKGDPVYGGTARWKRPKRRPTKHVRQKRARMERAAYLRA